MSNARNLLVTAALTAGLLGASSASALVVGYTNFDEFVTATSGMSTSIEDFDSYSSGETIADSGTLGAITYDYDFDSDILLVADLYDTTSLPNFLGTDSFGLIFNGETEFALSFGPSSAVGMFFISIDPLFDGDIALSSGSDSVSLVVADLVDTLPLGESVFFLGLVDTMGNGLTSVDIATTDFVPFAYNIDDIRLATVRTGAVPVPGTLVLLAFGLVACRFLVPNHPCRQKSSEGTLSATE